MTQQQASEDRVAHAIRSLRRSPANQAIQRSMYRVGEHELTPVQFDILEAVVRTPGQRMKDLAGLLGVDASTLSRTVLPLITYGLVERSPDPGDARMMRLVPTTSGLAQREAISSAGERMMETVRAHVGVDRWEQLADLLTLYVEALDVAHAQLNDASS